MTLVFDELPPLRVPLRFFLTAPMFGMAAGLLWALEGDIDFVVRWTPGMLAATHLFTLGFMAMVMIGALFQVVPVLGGGAIPRTLTIAPVVHAALTAGTASLAFGLYRESRAALVAALVLLGIAFLVFVPVLGSRILRRARRGESMYAIRFAVLSLAVTVAIGATMVVAIVWPGLGISHRRWTNVHAAWGFAGWMLLLIMGVSFQVVPMFHVTPAFPPRLARLIAPLVFLGLLLSSLAWTPGLIVAGTSLIAVPGAVYAATMLRLLAARKRRRAEPVVRAWQGALVCLIVALGLGWKVVCLPGTRLPGVPAHQEGFLLAVLFGLGGVATVILGMLSKVVPFLAFMHLQRRALLALAAIPRLPAMNEIVTEREARQVLFAHAGTCALVATAVLIPDLGRAAGLAVGIDFGLCLRNMVLAAWRYRRASLVIDTVVAAGQGRSRSADT